MILICVGNRLIFQGIVRHGKRVVEEGPEDQEGDAIKENWVLKRRRYRKLIQNWS